MRSLLYLLYGAWFFAVLCWACPTLAQVFDEDYGDLTTLDLETSLGLANNRMFRGQNLHNGTSFQPRIKPKLHTEVGSFYGEIFTHISGSQGDTKSPSGGSFDATDPEGNTVRVARVIPSYTEHIFDIGYELDMAMFFMDFGHRWYRYDEMFGRVHDTQEIYATIDFNVIAHPYFTAAYDYDVFEGLYCELGVRQKIPISLDGESSIVPFIKIGFSSSLDGDTDFIYDDSGATAVDFGLRGIFYIYDTVSLQPIVHYNEAIDDFATSEFSFAIKLVKEWGW